MGSDKGLFKSVELGPNINSLEESSTWKNLLMEAISTALWITVACNASEAMSAPYACQVLESCNTLESCSILDIQKLAAFRVSVVYRHQDDVRRELQHERS